MTAFFTALAAFFGAWPTIKSIVDLFIRTPQDKWADLNARLAQLNIAAMDAALDGAESGDYSKFEGIINGARRK